MMRKLYKFKGIHDVDSECHLALKKSQTPIVVVTEVPENGGTAIKDCFEKLATNIYHDHLKSHAPQEVIWVEHFPGQNTLFDHVDESYNKVLMEWNGQRYERKKLRRISGREVQILDLEKIAKETPNKA